MLNVLDKIKTGVLKHKIISGVLLLFVVFLGYKVYGKFHNSTGETRYVTTKVTKGTIISSITGSGQVAASNQININPTVSGVLTRVKVSPGDYVKAGSHLFSIDDTNAQKNVRDAEISLQNAKLSLEKIKIQSSNTNLSTALSKAYDDGFSNTSDTFLDIPGVMDGLKNMFFTSSINNNGQWNIDWYESQVSSDDIDKVKPYKQSFLDSYNAALTAYNTNYNNYKLVSRNSSSEDIEKIILETYEDLKLISNSIKNANNYLDFVNTSLQKNNSRSTPVSLTNHKNLLNNYTSQVNSHLSSLLSSKTNIDSNKDAFLSSDINVKSAEINIQQSENALTDARKNLSYYYITSLFDGLIASMPVQVGQNVSSGTTLTTLITKQKVATVALNEVDIAKVQLGQKATLSFDAIPNLSIAGKVAEIDPIGTVSQGVVNYNVKISFDTNDDSVKPGMSVNVSIITNIKSDVLLIPNSALKNQNGSYYVEYFANDLPAPAIGVQGSVSATLPLQKSIEVGISSDTQTEVTSGVTEGDIVVSKKIVSTTSTTTTPSILSAASGRNNSSTRIPGVGR